MYIYIYHNYIYINIYIYISHIPWLTIGLASLQWLAGADTGKPRSNGPDGSNGWRLICWTLNLNLEG